MKKLLALLVLLFMPIQTQAQEATIGLGFDHHHFSSDDQLGAISPDSRLRFISANGLRLSGSWMWQVMKDLHLGSELSLENSWVDSIYQSSYYTKTAGIIDTSDLMVQSVLLSAKAQAISWERRLLFLKLGFRINNLTSRLDRVDTDTGLAFGFEVTDRLYESIRIFLEVQALLSPTVRGKYEYDLALGLSLGIQQVFESKPEIQVRRTVKMEPAAAPVNQEAVKPPEPVTPTEAVTSPVAQQPLSEPIKAVIKLGPDGELSHESYPLIQRVLNVYSAKPSVINVFHRKDQKTVKLAREIKEWIISKEVPFKDIKLVPSNSLDKPIKIDVISR